MKKLFLSVLVLFCVGMIHAAQEVPLKHIETACVATRAQEVGREFASVSRNRTIAAATALGLVAIGAYATYRNWPAVYNFFARATPISEVTSSGSAPQAPASTKPQTDIKPSTSWTALPSALGSWVMDNVKNTIKWGPCFLALGTAQAAGSYALGPVLGWCARFFQSRDWNWITAKTGLNLCAQKVLTCAALLDTNSPQFDALKNTHINWQASVTVDNHNAMYQSYPAVSAQTQPNRSIAARYIPLNNFDELVRLQSIAQYGATLDEPARVRARQEFVASWNLFIAALTDCLGYLVYRHEHVRTDGSPTMAEHLRLVTNDIVTHTNDLATKLPELVHTSNGLLAAMHAYCLLFNQWSSTIECIQLAI